MEKAGGDLGEMVGKLMSDPQVASLVKRLKEDNASESGRVGEEDGSAPQPVADGESASEGEGAAPREEALSGLMQTLGPILGQAAKGSRDTENRNRLLNALKPYVNKERRDVIDKVTSISSLTGILDAAHRGSGR